MKTCIIALLSIAILFADCKKSQTVYIMTTVSGTVTDYVRGLPIIGAKVNVQHERYKINGEVAGYFAAGPPVKAITGPDGKYSITFGANNTGDTYTIALAVDSNYLNVSNPQKLTIGGKDSLNFNAYKLATLKAHIIMVNNPSPPLGATTNVGISNAVIYGSSADTVVNLRVVAGQPGGITFGIYAPGTTNALYYIQYFNLTGFSDTYYQTFNVDPSTFKPL